MRPTRTRAHVFRHEAHSRHRPALGQGRRKAPAKGVRRTREAKGSCKGGTSNKGGERLVQRRYVEQGRRKNIFDDHRILPPYHGRISSCHHTMAVWCTAPSPTGMGNAAIGLGCRPSPTACTRRPLTISATPRVRRITHPQRVAAPRHRHGYAVHSHVRLQPRASSPVRRPLPVRRREANLLQPPAPAPPRPSTTSGYRGSGAAQGPHRRGLPGADEGWQPWTGGGQTTRAVGSHPTERGRASERATGPDQTIRRSLLDTYTHRHQLCAVKGRLRAR